MNAATNGHALVSRLEITSRAPMRSQLDPIESFLLRHAALLLLLAGLVAILSGLIGVCIWFQDLVDRSDGDSLRYGFWHNPLMQFPPFNETFLEVSMWILLGCSAAAVLGGVMLLVPTKLGVPLVTLQARISIITNGAIAFFIVLAMAVFANVQFEEWHLGGTAKALALRLTSVAVDLTLWAFLSSNAVSELFARRAHCPDRAFEVIMKESR